MSDQPFIRRKPKHKRRTTLSVAFATGPVPAAAGGAPTLTLPERESARATVISGSIATLLHAGVVGVMVLITWLAPGVVDDIIRVKIIRDMPGSNEEPAPAPRALRPRRPAALAAAAVPRAVPQVVQPQVVQQISPRSLEMAQLAPTLAPTQIQRRTATSQRVDAHSSITVPRMAALDPNQLAAPTLDASDLSAPVVRATGPRIVAEGAQVDTAAPQVFAGFVETGEVRYSDQAQVSDLPTFDLAGSDFSAEAIDTGVAGEFLGGEGTGGRGTAIGVVRCSDSSTVQNYLALIKQRTEDRWAVPPGTLPDERVKLRFELDASGSATRVEFIEASNPTLGNSTVQALRAASPFPPMDDSVRCLSELRLYGTFDVPTL